MVRQSRPGMSGESALKTVFSFAVRMNLQLCDLQPSLFTLDDMKMQVNRLLAYLLRQQSEVAWFSRLRHSAWNRMRFDWRLYLKVEKSTSFDTGPVQRARCWSNLVA